MTKDSFLNRLPGAVLLDHLRGMEARILDRIEEIEQRSGGGDQRFLTIEAVASLTGLSDSHIRRAIRSGDLPAANMGTSSKPRWLIDLEDVMGWIELKKGGAPKVPPRPELKGLIERHLPGL